MQNTQQQISTESILDLIWHIIAPLRGMMDFTDMPLHILSILYAYHKGYPINIKQRHIEHVVENDPLYNDLVNAAPANDAVHSVLCNIQQVLEGTDRNHFNTIYPTILKGLFDLFNTHAGLSNGEFYTPREITKLMAYILKEENCTSIYDPFCGTAAIVHELTKNAPNIHFDGQELNHKIGLYARVNLEAACITHGKIRTCDSIRQWNNQIYDAVATCPPFNLIINEEQRREMLNAIPHDFRSIEGIVLTAPFFINKARLSVVLAPMGVCFRGDHTPNRSSQYFLRRYLIEENLLDAVIALPSNILYGTSIPSVMLICKKGRMPNDPITFVHAEEYYRGDKRMRTLDVDRLIYMMETSQKDCIKVTHSEIRDYDYNLNPSLYINTDFDLKEGQQIVRLGDIIAPIEGSRTHKLFDRFLVSNLSSDFIEILLRNSKVTDIDQPRRDYIFRSFEASDRKYLLANNMAQMDIRYGLFTDNKSFSCPSDIKVYVINESIVTPEYLAYILVNNPAISKGRMTLGNYMSFPLVIDSIENQKEVVSKLVQQYTAKVETEREADAKRLGIKQNISDLEHMLGSTQLRIGKIIKRLENYTPDMANYQQVVKQLKDNVEYMNRIIRYSNANIEQDSIYRKSDNLIEYVTSYVDGWINYGNNCFELSVINELDENVSISFDRNMLTVMLDSILNNAVRHGFHKKKMDGNIVQIRLSLVEHESKPFVLISVSNNGVAMKEGFTIDDFISRGRFSASTGRSGLGGFHTYQIVKGHDGFLYLDSNKQWSVIVEVLLPLDSSSINNIPEYDHECI